MPANRLNQSLLKPFVVLAVPGMYLVYKYNQFKRQQQENSRRKTAEKELAHLNQKIDKLLIKLDDHEPETPLAEGEECVVCLCAKATMQTYPCGHRVVCRKCFVKTIRVAVTQRCLPLRCVVCRTRVLKLKQAPPLPRSKSPGATAKALFGVGKSSSSGKGGGLSKGTLGGKLSGRHSTLVPVSRHPAALLPSPTGKPPAVPISVIHPTSGRGRSPSARNNGQQQAQAKQQQAQQQQQTTGSKQQKQKQQQQQQQQSGAVTITRDPSLTPQRPARSTSVHSSNNSSSTNPKDAHSKHTPLVLCTQRTSSNTLKVPAPSYTSSGSNKVRHRTAHVTRQ